jgi:hypothetical protein
MKTKRLLATVLLSAVALTGCGTQAAEEPPRKSQAAASSPSSEPAYETLDRTEAAYLVIAESQDMATGATDADLVQLGDTVCTGLRGGLSDVQVIAELTKVYGYGESGQIYTAAVTFLCPNLNPTT